MPPARRAVASAARRRLARPRPHRLLRHHEGHVEETTSAGRQLREGRSGRPLKKGLKLAFLPKQINNPYEKIVDKAGIAAAKEYGGTGKEVGPSDASDASSQVSYINTLIQQRPGRHPRRGERPERGVRPAQAGHEEGHQGRRVRLGHAQGLPSALHQPGQLGGDRPQPGPAPRRTDRLQGQDRDPVGDAERDEPEHLDQVHEGRAEESRSTRT